MIKSRRLIASLPRSGTTFIYYVMKNMGYSVAREDCDEGEYDIIVSYRHIVDFEVPECVFDKILHQVRNPIDCIGSLMAISQEATNYILSLTGVPSSLNEENVDLHIAMWIWLRFNEIIEQKATYMYKIEDVEGKIEEIISNLDLPAPKSTPVYTKGNKPLDINVLEGSFPSKSINSRKHEKLTLCKMNSIDRELSGEVIEKAFQYGYCLK